MKNKKRFPTLSLFTGAYGLDIGLEKAGFDVVWANELEDVFCKTVKLNKPDVEIESGDINQIDPLEVLKKVGYKRGEITLLCGGPPCQSFSTAGKRLSVEDARGNLIFTFIKWVDAIQPKYFLLENVRGLLSAAIKHRPLKERIEEQPLSDEEKRGSALKLILSEIDKIGYKVSYRLVNAADYGVPQTRQRVILLGSRDGSTIEFPEATHSKEGNIFGTHPWQTLKDAIGDLEEDSPQHSTYSASRLKWLKMVPTGGNWRSLPKDLQKEAMGGAYESGGGKVGFFRRLSWDKPSPTVTTAPHQKATDMCHPSEDRPLSVREYARIQQFPDEWQFVGSVSQQYKQIGNAVPVGLGDAIGGAIMRHIRQHEKASLRSQVNQLDQEAVTDKTLLTMEGAMEVIGSPLTT